MSKSKAWLSSFPGLPGFQAFAGPLLVSPLPHSRPYNRSRSIEAEQIVGESAFVKLGGSVLQYGEPKSIESWGCIAELVRLCQSETL